MKLSCDIDPSLKCSSFPPTWSIKWVACQISLVILCKQKIQHEEVFLAWEHSNRKSICVFLQRLKEYKPL